MKNRALGFTLLSGLVGALALGQVATAGVITSNPGLPPDTGDYLTAQQVHALYPDGVYPEIILENILHGHFLGIQRIPVGADEEETFSSSLTGNATVAGDPAGPILLQGPVQVLTQGKIGNTTGTFDTEIVSMSLAGTLGDPIEVRESPTLPSTGQTTITDLGGGLYQIDSFFDVFTEISVNGGPFVPAQGSVRVTLGIIPEPTIVTFLTLAGVTMLRRRRTA